MVLIKHLQQICGQLSKQSNYYFSCLCILSSHFSIGNSYDNRFLPVGQFQLLWSLIWSGSSYLFFFSIWKFSISLGFPLSHHNHPDQNNWNGVLGFWEFTFTDRDASHSPEIICQICWVFPPVHFAMGSSLTSWCCMQMVGLVAATVLEGPWQTQNCGGQTANSPSLSDDRLIVCPNWCNSWKSPLLLF